MNQYKLFYFHPLSLTFKSAQTIQVVKDYYFLSKLDIKVQIFGTYSEKDEFLAIKEKFSDSELSIIALTNNSMGKLFSKVIFFKNLVFSKERRVVVTRHYRKLIFANALKKIGFPIKIIHEMHEESFPYFFKRKIKKGKIQSLLLSKHIDCLVFTNYSQIVLFEKEFNRLPEKYLVIPNGVEIECFKGVSMANNYVLTYAGQFNEWKNVELIFNALSLLDAKYTLRIAGGKGGESSKLYIKKLINKYKIDASRVDYLGFVSNDLIPTKVLDKSNLLLLPLGDNIQSRYLTSPMKLFEYVATKVPILAVDYPSVSLLAKEGVFLSPNDPYEFAKTIRHICEQSYNEKQFEFANQLAKECSYEVRSLKFKREVLNEIC